jgi:tripartite-type tricarboxylate transporter receptor subunit TctC
LNYGSAGNGGISHLVPEMFKQATGTFIVHIPTVAVRRPSPT